MVGIDATAVEATMVKGQPIRDWAVRPFVIDPVGEPGAVGGERHDGIAIAVKAALPVPTVGLGINHVIDRRHPALVVSDQVPKRLTFAVAEGVVVVLRDRRRLPASTKAVAGRLRAIWRCWLASASGLISTRLAVGVEAVWPSVLPELQIEVLSGEIAMTTTAMAGRLDGHSVDLLAGQWGAIGGAVSAVPAFSLPELYHTAKNPRMFGGEGTLSDEARARLERLRDNLRKPQAEEADDEEDDEGK